MSVKTNERIQKRAYSAGWADADSWISCWLADRAEQAELLEGKPEIAKYILSMRKRLSGDMEETWRHMMRCERWRPLGRDFG